MNIKSIVEVVREIPPDHKPPKDPRQDRLTDLLAVFAIVGLAIWFQFLVRAWFYGNFFDFFFINFGNSSTHWLAHFLGVEPGQSIPTEGYGDYGAYYVPYVNAFTDGWNPYSGSIEPGDNIGSYVYGPFYILFISLGKMVFHVSTNDSIILSNLILNAFSSVMVYILAKRVTGNVFAFIFANINTIAPVALYYADIKVLNTPQMTFLTLLFVWLYIEHHDNSAFFVLVLAILTKQFPIILAMPVLLWMARRYGWVKATGFFVAGVFWFLTLSLPYILWDPKSYIKRLFVAGLGKSSILTYAQASSSNYNSVAPNLNWSSYPSQSSFMDQVLLMLFGQNLDQFSFILINSHIVWIFSLVLLAFPAWAAYRIMEADTVLYYRFFAAYLIIGHATIARGIYKYYDAYLLPFMLLALLPRTQHFGVHIRLGSMLNKAFATLFNPKYRQQEATMAYWGLFTASFATLAGIGFILNWAIALFLPIGYWRVLWFIVAAILAILFLVKPAPENHNILFLQKTEIDTEIPHSLTVVEYVISLAVAVAMIAAVFSVVFLQFYSSFAIVINSYSFLLVIIMIGSLYLYRALTATIEEFLLTLILAIPCFFIGDFTYILLGTDVSVYVHLLVAFLLGSTLYAAGKWLFKVYLRRSQITELLQQPVQSTWQSNKILLAIITFSMLFILEQFANLFFVGHVELYSQFVVVLGIILVVVYNLGDLESSVRTGSSFNWFILRPFTFVQQLFYAAFALFVFWKINVFILTTERLTGPSTVLAIGILIMGLLGWDFWHAFPRYLRSLWQSAAKLGESTA